MNQLERELDLDARISAIGQQIMLLSDYPARAERVEALKVERAALSRRLTNLMLRGDEEQDRN